jgi:DNA-directed RNA polymerase subunit RPC12/RpoP
MAAFAHETAPGGGRQQGEVTMATQTVVCPECGSPTAPGRYTCSDCGAFLDGVAVAPASPAPQAAAPDAPSWPGAEADPIAPERPEAAPAEPAVATAQPDARLEEVLPPADDVLLEDGPSLDPVDPTVPPPPDVLHDVQWPTPADDLPPALAPASFAAAGLAATDAPRVPAGAWLPPTGLLTGLDDGGSAATSPAAGSASPGSGATGTASRDWLAVLGPADRRWASARRTIAIGSAVELVGFLLPWAGGSLNSLLQVWTSVWGLAGAGHWLILLGVAALGVVAASSGRLAAIPLRLPAIVAASFLLGLIWPSVLGAGRPIGVLVVLVGVVVLAAGGILHPGARHEAATPDV